jgi:hypothetical protein
VSPAPGQLTAHTSSRCFKIPSVQRRVVRHSEKCLCLNRDWEKVDSLETINYDEAREQLFNQAEDAFGQFGTLDLSENAGWN